MHRVVRWKSLAWPGAEHLELRDGPDGILACGVTIGEQDGVSYGACYKVRLRSDWVFMAIEIEMTDGRTMSLGSDGAGTWRDGNGRQLPELDGCIDIDLSGSPFTNTLPIRRHSFAGAAPQRFELAWIPLDTLEPCKDGQIYTRLDQRRFLYQAADGSFERVLSVDDDGLVISYPDLFERS